MRSLLVNRLLACVELGKRARPGCFVVADALIIRGKPAFILLLRGVKRGFVCVDLAPAAVNLRFRVGKLGGGIDKLLRAQA